MTRSTFDRFAERCTRSSLTAMAVPFAAVGGLLFLADAPSGSRHVAHEALLQAAGWAWMHGGRACPSLIPLLLVSLVLYRSQSSRMRMIAALFERLFRLVYFVFLGMFVGVVGWAGGMYVICRESEGGYIGKGGSSGMLLTLGVLLLATVPLSILRGLQSTFAAFRTHWTLPWPHEKVVLPKLEGYSFQCDILAASDLHVVRDAETFTLESGAVPLGSEDAFVRQTAKASGAKLILLCGDLTDTGADEEWAHAEKLIGGLRASSVVIAAPGNHDVHFGRLKRETWWRTLGMLLQPFEPDATATLGEEKIVERLRKINSARELVDTSNPTSFPLVYEVAEPCLFVVVFNSNRRVSHSPLTNALGRIGADQIERAKTRLGALDSGIPVVFMMHHHVFPAPVAWVTPPTPFLTCSDSKSLLELAEMFGVRAILHGHTHTPYIYRHSYKINAEEKSILVISVGSAAFPADGPFKAELKTPTMFGLAVLNGEIDSVCTYSGPHSAHRAQRAEVGESPKKPMPPTGMRRRSDQESTHR